MITRSRSRKNQLSELIGEELPPLRLLDVNDSLLPVWQWLKQLQVRFDINNEEVLIGIDFDGTISNLNVSIHDTTTPSTCDYIRGGKASRLFLKCLEAGQYQWYVISARAYSVPEINNIVQTIQDKMNLSFPPHWLQDPQVQDCRINISKIIAPNTYVVYRVLQCANIIGCVQEDGGEYAFDKEVAIEQAMTQFAIQPKMIVFIDDNADNVLQVQQYYNNYHPEILFLGVFYFPQSDVQQMDYELAAALRT